MDLIVEGVVVHSRFAFRTRVSDSESSCTKSTSQSEQRVNPARYSALHSGQNMGGMIYRMRFSLSGQAPGTIGMRQLFFTKEIYFAMSKIRLFSILVRC